MVRKRRWVGWFIFAALGTALVVIVSYRLQPTIGHADVPNAAVKDLSLPATARNIDYFLPGEFGPVTAFEFDVTETEFVAWLSVLPAPALTPATFNSVRCIDATGYPNGEREIQDGLVYSRRHEDSSIVAAYDRTQGRAYYLESTR